MLARRLIDSLLPEGALWAPEEGRELDDLLDGIAACLDGVRVDMLQLADVRNPLKTPMLEDLEREFGIMPSTAISEAVRRSRLAGRKASRTGDGSGDYLQSVLTAAGFEGLHVHLNTPPVDPSLFVYYAPSAICGNATAICGASIVGGQRGGILVNSGPDAIAPAGSAGDQPGQYLIPPEPYWPLFFFIGGAATWDGEWHLATIADAEVPVERRAELASLILRCKPMHAWAAMRVTYI